MVSLSLIFFENRGLIPATEAGRQGGPLSPYTRDIEVFLQLGLTPEQIGAQLRMIHHLGLRETEAKKISDRISYLKKNNLIHTPAVNGANGNMWALPAVQGPQNPVGCTPHLIMHLNSHS